MSWKCLTPLVFALAFLLFAEGLLEIRAHSRGYKTILFGDIVAEDLSNIELGRTRDGSEVQAVWGPTKDFAYRSRVLHTDKSANAVRVWISSASHAEDVRVSVERVFPNMLSTLFAQRGQVVEVINASRAGMSIGANKAELVSEFKNWNPDAVILYQLVNDFTRITKGSEGNSEVGAAGIGIGFQSRINAMLQETTLYPIVKTNVSARIREKCLLPIDLPLDADNDFLCEIEGFVDSTRLLGVEPILCTFAMSHDELSFFEMPVDYRLGMLRQNPSVAPLGWIRTKERWNQKIRQYCEENKVLLLDVDRSLGGRAEFFRDAVHFNEKGHAKFADHIARFLTEVEIAGANDK